MKYSTDRPYSDPDKAARRLMQHAHAFEPVQDGRIYIKKVNGPFLFGDKGVMPNKASASRPPPSAAGCHARIRDVRDAFAGQRGVIRPKTDREIVPKAKSKAGRAS
jgi:hypothetical protein